MVDREPQTEIFAFMAAPATHGGATVKQIDTHISAVFLAGDRVFKLKRAVKFPYLDYSTLEKRHTACMAELEVNRRFAPELYLRAAPITREANDKLAIGGSGLPVEWAVEMRRFDENRTLDHMANEGLIDSALADALGRTVAAAHAVALVVEADPWIAALETYLDQNKLAFAENPALFSADEATMLHQFSQQALAGLKPLLRERGKNGFVRQGHGDLNLSNIALIENWPVPFDAVEFDPLVATGDVLYDLAFLLMDLTERGLKQAANIVLNRYLSEVQRNENLDALAALPFFLSLRAAISAKVNAARSLVIPESERAVVAASAQKYFRFACAFIRPDAPMLVAIGGLSGTGKSVLACLLAPEIPPAPGAIVLRSDSERKRQFGIAETEQLGSEAYRPQITSSVYSALADKARRILAAGHTAIVDAVYATPEERRSIKEAAGNHTFHGIFLTANLPTRLMRVGQRTSDASDADRSVVMQQEAYDPGSIDWTVIDASGSPADTFSASRKVISKQSS